MTATVQPLDPLVRVPIHQDLTISEQELTSRNNSALQLPGDGGPEMNDDENGTGENADVEEDEDDDEDLQASEVTTKHLKLCKTLGIKLNDVNTLYDCLEEHKELITKLGTNSETFIHALVKQLKKVLATKPSNQSNTNNKANKYDKWLAAMPNIISWIIYRNIGLLKGRKDSNQTAFEFACEQFIKVAYHLLHLLLDKELEAAINAACQKKSQTPCSVELTHPLIQYLKSENKGDDWCPHTDKDRILEFHKQLKIIIIASTNSRSHSKNSCLHHAIKNFRLDPDTTAVARLVRLSDEDAIRAKENEHQNTPLLAAIAQFEKPLKEDGVSLQELAKIISLIIEVCPNALYDENSNKNTAYMQLISYNKNSEVRPNTRSDAQPEAKIKDLVVWQRDKREFVLNILKEAIIGDLRKQRHEQLQYLYPPGITEQQICLDLGSSKPIGLEYVSALVERTFKEITFETALSYVCLPPRNSSTTSATEKGVGILEDYRLIFDFLKKRKVKKIFRVDINDLVGRPHTDEMIIKLVNGFNIKHWQWKKLDMSSETIFEAAKEVNAVSLHCSGNYSVLQGWACDSGLIKLEKLTKVDVVIHQGTETETSLSKYRQWFKEALKQRFASQNRQLELEVCFGTSIAEDPEHALQGNNSVSVSQKKANHDWIKHMEEFVQEFRNLNMNTADSTPKRTVKVALIDDGIDPVTMRFRVAQGKSFTENETASHDNYYVEAGPHGTVMASLINKMCPGVELYCAKIARNSSSTIVPTAAAQAIEWAVEKKVDIISMSWSFTADTVGANEFKKAIEHAVQKSILLFASLRESEDALVMDGFYPVSLPGVFKIGSATRFGSQVKSHSGDTQNVEFILPGREVLLQLGRDSQLINGSSVATALATGLAALVLDCSDRIEQHADDKEQSHSRRLRQTADMKYVFENLSRGSDNNKYPQVQKYFTWNKNKDLTDGDLAGILTSLTSGSSISKISIVNTIN